MDEEQEEKRRKIHRATHDDDDDDRSQPDHIPLDLTLEIFSRLPARSVVRFRCLSKFWSSYTTGPSFVSRFASRSSSRSPSLLLTFSQEGKRFVVSFPDGSYSPAYSYQLTNPNDWRSPRSESVHGLVLLGGYKIWNPSLRSLSALRYPFHCSVPESFLGYDPVEGKHKVLCMFVNEHSSLQPRVLTLGAQESWRIITQDIPMHSPGELGRCFNGVLYYEAHVYYEPMIMSFDVKSESFSPIKYPKCSGRWNFHMIPYEGRLALITNCFTDNRIDLFILKDVHGHEWTRQCFIHVACTNFKGVTHAGELIFAPRPVSESYYVLYLDPKRNSTRKVFFEGTVGDEFRRRYGLAKSQTYDLEFFPNHMDSLVSL